jgi:hypothetical protein
VVSLLPVPHSGSSCAGGGPTRVARIRQQISLCDQRIAQAYSRVDAAIFLAQQQAKTNMLDKMALQMFAEWLENQIDATVQGNVERWDAVLQQRGAAAAVSLLSLCCALTLAAYISVWQARAQHLQSRHMEPQWQFQQGIAGAPDPFAPAPEMQIGSAVRPPIQLPPLAAVQSAAGQPIPLPPRGPSQQLLQQQQAASLANMPLPPLGTTIQQPTVTLAQLRQQGQGQGLTLPPVLPSSGAATAAAASSTAPASPHTGLTPGMGNTNLGDDMDEHH